LFVGLNSIVAVYTITVELTTNVELQSLYTVAPKGNIFVLSFDGISGSAALETLQEDEPLAQLFKGFTVFKNVASSSPATAASTAATLYGNQDFRLHSKTMKQVWDSAPELLFTNVINDSGFRVSTFGHYNTNFNDTNRKHLSSVARGIGASEVLQYSIARTLSSRLVSSGA